MDVTFYGTGEFEKWVRSLDRVNSARVLGKLRFVATLGGPALGMPLVRALGDRLYELQVDKYRISFTVAASSMLVLAAGEKDTQPRDLDRARRRHT